MPLTTMLLPPFYDPHPTRTSLLSPRKYHRDTLARTLHAGGVGVDAAIGLGVPALLRDRIIPTPFPGIGNFVL